MLIKYKDLIFNTEAIKTARKEKVAAIGGAIHLVRIVFIDDSEEQFTGPDASKVWQLLSAAAKTPTQE